MKVAFIGLGIMGSRMAANLLKNEVDLTVYNRTMESALPLGEMGARVSGSAAEAVRDADVVFSMLSTPQVVADVFWGEGNVLQSMKKCAWWLDCTTVNPSFSMQSKAEAEKVGVKFLDAPVSGSKPQAQNADLLFLVGATEEEASELDGFFNMMGKKTFYMGETGKGASFKMIINMMMAQSMALFSEAVLLGEKMGISREFLLDTLPNLIVTPPFVKNKINAISTGNYEVMFPLEWMHKDLHLAALSAYENNQPLYLANVAKEMFESAKAKGMGRLDFSAIFEYLEGH
ncbi:MAG: NAD(P)-dependent oxidoreductase [Bacteroidales bacterium]|nr:NAD(P)-dependent oxidoreductase [Bacteroidales bacterium]